MLRCSFKYKVQCKAWLKLSKMAFSLLNLVMMRVMECASPIDLRVSKGNEICDSQTSWPSKVSERVPFYRQPQSPLFQPILYGSLPGFQPSYKDIHPVSTLVTISTPTSPKPNESITCASPDSSIRGCDSCKSNSGNDLKGVFERGSTKRRLSEGSTLSSSSNFSEDSNNNNNGCGETQTTADSCPEKKKKIPDITRSTSVEVECKDAEDENLMKKDPDSPNPSRISVSPASFSSGETENCDSSTRPRSTRPFKAITSSMMIDPLPLSGPLGDFEAFRQSILSRVNSSNKSTNQNMRRSGNTANTHITDPAYWEKRRRNNEAAKRSRDARRRKEDEVAIRCAYLEQERILMLQENKMLKEALKKYQEYYMP